MDIASIYGRFRTSRGARVYDATSQRWMEQDPDGFAAGDADLYRYVGNSPANATDPSGELISGLVTVGFMFYDTYQWSTNGISNEEYSIRMGINFACLAADAATGGFGGGSVVRAGGVAARGGGVVLRGGAMALEREIVRGGVVAGLNVGARAGVEQLGRQGLPNFDFAAGDGNQVGNNNPPAVNVPRMGEPLVSREGGREVLDGISDGGGGQLATRDAIPFMIRWLRQGGRKDVFVGTLEQAQRIRTELAPQARLVATYSENQGTAVWQLHPAEPPANAFPHIRLWDGRGSFHIFYSH